VRRQTVCGSGLVSVAGGAIGFSSTPTFATCMRFAPLHPKNRDSRGHTVLSPADALPVTPQRHAGCRASAGGHSGLHINAARRVAHTAHCLVTFLVPSPAPIYLRPWSCLTCLTVNQLLCLLCMTVSFDVERSDAAVSKLVM
jgi:hypothetical protein